MPNSAYRVVAMGALALLVALLVAVAVILLIRENSNAPVKIYPPASGEAATSAPVTASVTPPSPGPVPDWRVYVHGAVERPGVYPVKSGDRLVDALDAAGGATDDADLTSVNLAQRVRDEGYYYIPRAGETPPPVAASSSHSTSPLPSDVFGNASAGNGLIDLNTASVEALKTLPGIGDVRAQAIVAHREQNGPFSSTEQVMEITGIGEGTYESIKDLVTVGGK